MIYGLSAGVAHSALLLKPDDSFFDFIASASAPELLGTFGSVLVWVVMTIVIWFLVRYAVLFARLGRDHVPHRFAQYPSADSLRQSIGNL